LSAFKKINNKLEKVYRSLREDDMHSRLTTIIVTVLFNFSGCGISKADFLFLSTKHGKESKSQIPDASLIGNIPQVGSEDKEIRSENNPDVRRDDNPEIQSDESSESLDKTKPPKIQNAGFFIDNDKLIDKSGNQFVIRGINMPFAYFYDRSFGSLNTVRNEKFNAVRIIWCANNLIRSGRCDTKDMRSIEDLSLILKKMRELELVAILNLQNATGSDNPEHLSLLVDWYLQPEVKSLLNEYQDMLLINIANEWYGSWEDPTDTYIGTYKSEILRIREAGITNVLIIDARGWGQQFSSLLKLFPEIKKIDSGIMYSAHMYDLFPSADIVNKSFDFALEMKIPLIIGEFGCTHYPGQNVACDAIMENSETRPTKYGYVAWSYSGNSGLLQQLDIFDSGDWITPTSYGNFIINEFKYGIKNTSKLACLFPGQKCNNEGEN
jgi:mannan endo-1,4-beta-mannosidase